MIHENTDEDIRELEEIHAYLNAEAEKLGVTLEWVEINDTIFFKPMLAEN